MARALHLSALVRAAEDGIAAPKRLLMPARGYNGRDGCGASASTQGQKIALAEREPQQRGTGKRLGRFPEAVVPRIAGVYKMRSIGSPSSQALPDAQTRRKCGDEHQMAILDLDFDVCM